METGLRRPPCGSHLGEGGLDPVTDFQQKEKDKRDGGGLRDEVHSTGLLAAPSFPLSLPDGQVSIRWGALRTIPGKDLNPDNP